MSGFGASLAGAAAAPAGAGAGGGGGAVSGGGSAAAGVDYRAQVFEIYYKYNQNKLGEVDKLLTKYRQERARDRRSDMPKGGAREEKNTQSRWGHRKYRKRYLLDS